MIAEGTPAPPFRLTVDRDANARFADQEGLRFPLLSDLDRAVVTAYQVVRDPDDMFADTPRRVTYLIDPAGVIRRHYLVTDAAGHADQLLADLRALTAASCRAPR